VLALRAREINFSGWAATGLPSKDRPHETVHKVGASPPVIDVDIDPIAAALGASLLRETDKADIVRTDFRCPTDVVILMLMLAWRRLILDSGRPDRIAHEYRERLGSGSQQLSRT
jgi:hypothetical protein